MDRQALALAFLIGAALGVTVEALMVTIWLVSVGFLPI